MKSSIRHRGSDFPFFATLVSLGAIYLLLILGMLFADAWYAATNVTGEEAKAMMNNEDIQHSIRLTLITCTVSTLRRRSSKIGRMIL